MWATTGATITCAPGRERVLPTGDTHLVFRLGDTPLRIFDTPDDAVGRTIGCAVVGGARASYYLRATAMPSRSVGAQLRPGAARLLFAVPADELAERHTRLDDLLPGVAVEMRERLWLAGDPAHQLAILEAFLLSRLPSVRGLHPAVAQALAQLDAHADVRRAVAASGYSHRGFTALFRRDVGLAPKRYCRVLRFQRVIEGVAAGAALADVALAAGYADQPHFTRDFREFTGVTPSAYRRLAPARSHHVPLGTVDFVQDGRRRSA